MRTFQFSWYPGVTVLNTYQCHHRVNRRSVAFLDILTSNQTNGTRFSWSALRFEHVGRILGYVRCALIHVVLQRIIWYHYAVDPDKLKR